VKWADFCISAVRYSVGHQHIDRVKVHVDSGESIGVAVEYTRQQVISLIKQGKSFLTIFRDNEGSWTKGQPVYVIRVNDVEYIKTVDNGKEQDNLENLPEF
jgi:hypothetical protein